MALLRRRAENTAAVVAAATEYRVIDQHVSMQLALTRQPWQIRAYGYYHEIGEIRFATRFVGNALSQIKLVAAETSKETGQPEKTKNEAVNDAISKLKSSNGGQGNLLRSIAQALFLAGEVFLVGYSEEDAQHWDALSIREIEFRPPGWVRRPLPNAPFEDISEDALVIRIWMTDPEFSGLADSAMRTLLNECEKLLLLTRADKAVARSRFAGSGLLFVPNELIPATQQDGDNTPQGSGPDYTHPVQRALIESMISPIKDESHPSSVVPVVLFGPAEFGSQIRHISFAREADRSSQARREEARSAIAAAVDLPAEVLTGKYDLNHWTAWQIREETFQAHLQPFVELIVDSLTTGYLQPALKRAGVSNYEDYFIWYDDSNLIARPNKGESADRGVSELAVSLSAWRREHGFTEEDAPSEEEYAKRVGLKVGDPGMATTGKVSEPPAAPPGVGTSSSGAAVKDPQGISPKEIPSRGENDDQPGPAKTVKPSDGKTPSASKAVTASGKPDRPFDAATGRRLAQLDIDLMRKIQVAADEIFAQAFNKIGAKIRAKVKSQSVYADLIVDTPNAMLASVLGPSIVNSLEIDDRKIIESSTQTLSDKALIWGRESQVARNQELANYISKQPRGSLRPWEQIRNLKLDDAQQSRRDQNREDAQNDEWVNRQFDAFFEDRDNEALLFGVSLLTASLVAYALNGIYNFKTEPLESLGELDGRQVPSDLIRTAVEAIGGGNGGKEIGADSDYKGVGISDLSEDILGANGVEIIGYQWVYGNALRRPFDAHAELDGEFFESFDDEVLETQPQDDWLGVSHYHPRDHVGCLCQIGYVLAKSDDGDADENLVDAEIYELEEVDGEGLD